MGRLLAQRPQWTPCYESIYLLLFIYMVPHSKTINTSKTVVMLFYGIGCGSQFERGPIVKAGKVHQTSTHRKKSSKPCTWFYWVYLLLCCTYAVLSIDPLSPELFALESRRAISFSWFLKKKKI